MAHRFTIDKETDLVFAKSSEVFTDWKGDIVLERGEEKIIVQKNADIFGPGGFAYRIYKSSAPDIVILRGAFGDGGILFIWQEYLNINTGQVVASISNSQGFSLEIERKGQIDRVVLDVDSCVDRPMGERAELKGTLLNGALAARFGSPISLNCVDPGGIGPVYDPNPVIEEILLSTLFSKVSFVVRGEEWKNDAQVVQWEEPVTVELP